MDRRSKILRGIDYNSASGLEIGALAWPIVSKSEGNIHFVDFASAEYLRGKYENDASVDLTRIIEPDFIWSGHAGLQEVIGLVGPVDYVIASHVIEHVPDFITWLTELASVLSDAGEIRLVIPDRRFTFDFLRHETVVADVVEAWLQKQSVPSARAITDMIINFVDLDRLDAWRDRRPNPSRRPVEASRGVISMGRDAIDHGVYHDVHCWVFTPKSLALLMRDLIGLDVLCLECTYFHDTEPGDFEFFIGLRKTSDAEAALASWLSMAIKASPAPWEHGNNSRSYDCPKSG